MYVILSFTDNGINAEKMIKSMRIKISNHVKLAKKNLLDLIVIDKRFQQFVTLINTEMFIFGEVNHCRIPFSITLYV